MVVVKLKVTKGENSGRGILYILVMDIDGEVVYKVGVTQRDKIEDRVCEILASFFKSYRYFCWVRPKRFKKTDDVYEKEAKMHKYLSEYQYTSEKKFSGNSEIFHGINLDILVDLYEDILTGNELDMKEWKETYGKRNDDSKTG